MLRGVGWGWENFVFFAAAHIIYWLTTGLKVGGGGGSDMGRAVRDRIRRDKKGAVFASHMYL